MFDSIELLPANTFMFGHANTETDVPSYRLSYYAVLHTELLLCAGARGRGVGTTFFDRIPAQRRGTDREGDTTRIGE